MYYFSGSVSMYDQWHTFMFEPYEQICSDHPTVDTPSLFFLGPQHECCEMVATLNKNRLLDCMGKNL